MATNSMFNELNELLASNKAKLRVTLGDEKLSKNLKHRYAYELRKVIKHLTLSVALSKSLSEDKVDALLKDKNVNEAYTSIINPGSGGSRILVKEGDTVLSLMKEYKGEKNLLERAEKAAEKAGLTLNDEGKFVKK